MINASYNTFNDDNDDICYICRSKVNDLSFRPCLCRGTLNVHETCLVKWIEYDKVNDVCSVCHSPYLVICRPPSPRPSQYHRRNIIGIYIFDVFVTIASSVYLFVTGRFTHWDGTCLMFLMMGLTVFSMGFDITNIRKHRTMLSPKYYFSLIFESSVIFITLLVVLPTSSFLFALFVSSQLSRMLAFTLFSAFAMV